MCDIEQIKKFLLFVKEHDIPNWFILIFTGIGWPLVLFLWNMRKLQNIPNLEVSPTDGIITINGTEYPALWLKFSNQTGSTVYLSNARLLKCTKLFKVASTSTRDLAESAYELNFSDGSGKLNQRQIILHTNDKTETAIALDSKPGKDILSFKPPIWRKNVSCPKYFCLEYIAMVGKKRYKISTIY
ncbi:MAG: hypothetical protein NTW12_10695 [Deltaproteobacteria bacterium]|nr:hypothetical protein [Deltaproteobacteria bacterium]